MANRVTQYDLLVSCPGDIDEEIDVIKESVEKFNQLFSDVIGISIRIQYWRTSGYAQSGDKPQNLLNRQFVEKCDAAVAIFWTRFGTPTDKYGSGTEEEIEYMLEQGKQVFMYFSDKKISPSQVNSAEYEKVQNFKKRYKNKGVYYSYSTKDEFAQKFFAHLSKYFLSQESKEEKVSRQSKLILKGINQNSKLSDDAYIYPFTFSTEYNKEFYLNKINALYKKINSIACPAREKRASYHIANIFTVVELDEAQRKVIEQGLKQLGYEINEGFFSCGNLSVDLLSANLPHTEPHYIGTDEEIKKYNALLDLHDAIHDACFWLIYEQAFSGKYALKLALQNGGTYLDEDIEVTIKLPKGALFSPYDCPQFPNDTMELILNEYNLKSLFGIAPTSEYKDYDSSIKTPYTPDSTNIVSPFSEPDYTNLYESALSEIFCYEKYDEDDLCLLKLKVDYLKHYNAIAFPSIIFLTQPIERIAYTISSKNNTNVVEGKLKIVNLPKFN